MNSNSRYRSSQQPHASAPHAPAPVQAAPTEPMTDEQIARIQNDMRARNWDVSQLHIWQVLETANRLFPATPADTLKEPTNQTEWDRVYGLIRHWAARARKAEEALAATPAPVAPLQGAEAFELYGPDGTGVANSTSTVAPLHAVGGQGLLRQALDILEHADTTAENVAMMRRHHDLVQDIRKSLSSSGEQPASPTVEQAIQSLVSALADSKGWMRDYADAIVRDAIDRRGGEGEKATEGAKPQTSFTRLEIEEGKAANLPPPAYWVETCDGEPHVRARLIVPARSDWLPGWGSVTFHSSRFTPLYRLSSTAQDAINAARYRWLREAPICIAWPDFPRMHALDEAIDAARNAHGGQP